jgi:hypothetical protein
MNAEWGEGRGEQMANGKMGKMGKLAKHPRLC